MRFVLVGIVDCVASFTTIVLSLPLAAPIVALLWIGYSLIAGNELALPALSFATACVIRQVWFYAVLGLALANGVKP